MTILIAFIACILPILYPLVRPSKVLHVVYKVHLPLFLILGISAIVFVFHGDYKSVYLEYALYAYLSYVLLIIGFCELTPFISPMRNIQHPSGSCSSFKLVLSSYIYISFFIVLLCIPFWLLSDISKTGLYSLFFDSAHHLLLREQSLKLADKSIVLTLYKMGASLIVLPVLSSFYLLFYAKNKSQAALIFIPTFILMMVTNIQGARSGFLMPIAVSVFSLQFSFIFHLQRDTFKIFYDINRLVVSRVFIKYAILFIVFLLCFIFVLSITSFLRLNRELDAETSASLLVGVFERILGAPFATGVWNIEAIHELRMPLVNWVGGFPGASMLNNSKLSVFMQTGSYYSSTYLGLKNLTTNMNTSGLFLNTAFFGYCLGPLIFATFLIFNIYGFKKLVLKPFCSTKKSHLRPIIDIMYSQFLGTLSFEIVNSSIGLFPEYWILSFLILLFLFKAPRLIL